MRFSLTLVATFVLSVLANDKDTELTNLRASSSHAREGEDAAAAASLQDDVFVVEHVHENGRRLKLTAQQISGEINIVDMDKGDSLKAQKDKTFHVLTFTASKGNIVQIKTSPQLHELTIRKLGGGKDKKNTLTDEDREFFNALSESLRAQESAAFTMDDLDAPATQASRMAAVLRDWPQELDLDYTFDQEAEMDRLEQREYENRAHPEPDAETIMTSDGPVFSERRLLESHSKPSAIVIRDEHGRRRLAYDMLCDMIGRWVWTTHNDENYARDDWQTSFYAKVGEAIPPDVPAMNGAICNNNAGKNWWSLWVFPMQWQCFQPNHRENIWFGEGNCFGRCGGIGCSAGNTYLKQPYTVDCLDYHSCLRFGPHAPYAFACLDEYTNTVDDASFAPDCCPFGNICPPGI